MVSFWAYLVEMEDVFVQVLRNLDDGLLSLVLLILGNKKD